VFVCLFGIVFQLHSCLVVLLYCKLTDDSSAPENKTEASVDARVTEFLLCSDSMDLIFDLRANNGRPKDCRLNPS
jgi:hypothetical protein